MHTMSMILDKILLAPFRSQSTWWGVASVTTFDVIIFLGILSSISGIVDPVHSDCGGDNFEEGTIEYGFYKANVFMVSLFVILFLLAVAVAGHSIVTCTLLLCAPVSNSINFYLLMRYLQQEADPMVHQQESLSSSSSLDCAHSNISGIRLFLSLCLVALSTAILEECYSNKQRGRSTAPTEEETPILARPS